MNEPSGIERVLSVVMTIVFLMAMVYEMVPEHQRKLLMMKATAELEQATSKLARASGRLAMRRELAGGRPGYELPEALSRLRDFAGVLYERMRSS